MKAASIRQALGLDVPMAGIRIALPVVQPPEKSPATKKTAPVAKAPSVTTAPTPKKTATPQAKPSKTPENKPQIPVRKSLGPKEKEKVIENLRLHPKNRPVKRKTLESHITSLVGGNVATKAVQGLVAGLENEGVIKFSDKKIEYKIPKLKK
jgi:hypothetical protein